MQTGEENTKLRVRSTKSFLTELTVYLIMIFVCVYIVPEFVLQRTVVKGESMENTLQTGESLLVEKLTIHFKDPARYDIVIFNPKNGKEDELYVKRVIGLPGETVQIKGNDILINGNVIIDEYAKDGMGNSGIAAEPITLKEDEFFVLGDNRFVSLDSRVASVGPVKRQQISGRAMFRIWPVNKIGKPK